MLHSRDLLALGEGGADEAAQETEETLEPAKDDADDIDLENFGKKKKKKKKVLDDDEERKRKRFGMNPEVNTAFLPDRDRDEQENEMREKLRVQWEENQKRVKEEDVEIAYSYWDGSGHRKNITMKKGNSIYQFLVKVLNKIRTEFPELKTVSGDQLMYVKEDLIIPQTNTFYDFIVSRARGKTGPLFNFEVKEDIRLLHDATVEKEESHAGKVVLRSWYDRNKHIFPASRWEPFDPTKDYALEERKRRGRPDNVRALRPYIRTCRQEGRRGERGQLDGLHHGRLRAQGPALEGRSGLRGRHVLRGLFAEHPPVVHA